MLTFHDHDDRSGTLSRREWLRVGGLSALGLSLPTLLAAQRAAAVEPVAPPSPLAGELSATFGKAKSVIFLWLQGGPPQHETFDPKPDAPAEIRGPFQPIATNVPGIQFCELLPRTARYADRLAVVRSLSTRDDNHDVSGYWLLTGYPYGPGSARQIKPTDWPYFGSIVKMLKPSEKLPALTSVWIPDVMRLNDNVTPAGQTAGFLGKQWEPERFVGDPALPDYQIEGLTLYPGIDRLRMDRRRDLLRQFESQLGGLASAGATRSWDRLKAQAFDLVTSGEARAAFDLSREPDRVRDRYGRYTWGQSCLLARRLVEAGVRLVHVNWARDPGDNAVDNPLWDTHALNADRLQDNLCPQFDPTFAALMDDLSDRGLLDETLVVAIGEFGRTPKINANGGRDHWGHVFSFAMAGAGIRGGQVIGASDKHGAYPASTPLTGGDLTATIYHLLGIDPRGFFPDKESRPHPLTKGEPIAAMLGTGSAATALQAAAGDPNFVPPFDTRLLFDTDFASESPLIPVAPTSRAKGWRGWPLAGDVSPLLANKSSQSALLGFTPDAAASQRIEPGQRAILAQEIRDARGGQFKFTAQVRGEALTKDDWERRFLAHFRCRLVLYRFQNLNKDPRAVQELASVEFSPTWGESREFVIDRFLGSTTPGANFSIGSGLGVAVVVERTSSGPLEIPAGESRFTGIRVAGITLTFEPRRRDDSVVV